MQTTNNTFCKFEEYKKKRVGELLKNYEVSWLLIVGNWLLIGGVMCALVSLLPYCMERYKLLIDFIMGIWSISIIIILSVKYIRFLQVQNCIYDCLIYFSAIEDERNREILVETLKEQKNSNFKEVKRLRCSINNLELKCRMINKLIKTNYLKSFTCGISSKSLNEYKEMVKDKRLFIQDRCSYRQLKNKYKTDILLLKAENNSLDSRIKNYEERAVDKKRLHY